MKKQLTYCRYPFRAIALKRYDENNMPMTFWPCCMMGNNTKEDIKNSTCTDGYKLNSRGDDFTGYTPIDFFNHPRMEELRKNLLSGVRDHACTVCWEMEDAGFASFRNMAGDPDDMPETPSLETIDMSINNLCNLRCRMCTPSASSALDIDTKFFKDNGILDKVNEVTGRWGPASIGAFKLSTNQQWNWIIANSDKFKNLRLSGGEPFYNKDVLKFIDTAIENGSSKNLTLEFHTNGTLFTDELVGKLQQFNLNLNFSIDGNGDVYEYVRFPATQKQLDDSMYNLVKNMKEAAPGLPNCLSFNVVMMSLNIFNYSRLIDWFAKLAKVGNKVSIVNFAEIHPQNRGISIENLPVYLLEESAAELEEALNLNKGFVETSSEPLNIITNAIKNNTENKQKMLEEITLFDMSRNQSYKDFLDIRLIKWLES